MTENKKSPDAHEEKIEYFTLRKDYAYCNFYRENPLSLPEMKMASRLRLNAEIFDNDLLTEISTCKDKIFLAYKENSYKIYDQFKNNKYYIDYFSLKDCVIFMFKYPENIEENPLIIERE